MKESTFIEKIALLALAGGCVISLTWIALDALKAGSVDPNASTLIGVIAAGLIAFGKDIVAAIRSYAMSAQLGKVTDQLAASGPVVDAPPPPADAQEAAEQVADAAVGAKDKITERTEP
jgi:hypothetical protein